MEGMMTALERVESSLSLSALAKQAKIRLGLTADLEGYETGTEETWLS
jgi:hypothetical protein